MTDADELWIPLVDEPLGTIIAEVQAAHPEIDELVVGARRTLAFRTFAYVRVGMLLGQLLVDQDVSESDSWVEALLESPANRDLITREVIAVAREVAADAKYGDEEPVGPDEETRARFRDFARRRLQA
jgi:hypothetical protein